MPRIRNCLTIVIGALAFSHLAVADEIIVQDGNATISQEQLTYMVTNWTAQMRSAAILDDGDRLELLNLELAGIKIANQAEKIVADDVALRQSYQTDLRAFKRNFVLKQFEQNIKYPDFSRLARERYDVEKDKYALIPERRLASHILLESGPGEPREEKLAKAQEILDQLRAGADWEEMVAAYSDEPNAAQKKGLFDYWMTYGDKRVSPPFSEAVFSVEKVGDFAEVTQSQFGVHVIRLDGIQEKSYKTFDEAKDGIIKELKGEYRRLALKDYLVQFNMSDNVVVDDDAVKAILAPYADAAEAEADETTTAE
ncbi:peptidylprolyl isomerase [Haliea sp. E17]|uniref:peptidylprolyl isomerase n=1 Tax=Haliea sp. E17 TaxID=3401576 RepID=UPI003AACE4B5